MSKTKDKKSKDKRVPSEDEKESLYLLLLLKEDKDFLLTKASQCLDCLEKKARIHILKTYPLSENAFGWWKNQGIQALITVCTHIQEKGKKPFKS